ncbi:MAG: hypothetical protein ACRD68_18950, partial [Pyrinomonadaceae bacterium]
HAVRAIDLKTGQTSTLKINGLRPPETKQTTSEAGGPGPNAEEIKLAPQRLGAGGDAALLVDVALPEGYHLNPSAPHRYRASIESGGAHIAFAGDGDATPVPAAKEAPAPKEISRTSKDLKLPLRIPIRARAAGAAVLRVQLTLYYCREDNTGTCLIKTLVWRAPVDVSTGEQSPREIRLQARVGAR